jgi:hypothetical protein
LNQIPLNKYSVIILSDGNYSNSLNKSQADKLKTWIQNGGTLITLKRASIWASQQGLSSLRTRNKTNTDSTLVLPYAIRQNREGAQEIGGAIFKATLDLTHPIAFGYNDSDLYLFKDNDIFAQKSPSPYNSPIIYTNNPLESGYISKLNYDLVKNSSALNIYGLGNGKIISFIDNPNFRAFWYGGNKLFLNALFFAQFIKTR